MIGCLTNTQDPFPATVLRRRLRNRDSLHTLQRPHHIHDGHRYLHHRLRCTHRSCCIVGIRHPPRKWGFQAEVCRVDAKRVAPNARAIHCTLKPAAIVRRPASVQRPVSLVGVVSEGKWGVQVSLPSKEGVFRLAVHALALGPSNTQTG